MNVTIPKARRDRQPGAVDDFGSRWDPNRALRARGDDPLAVNQHHPVRNNLLWIAIDSAPNQGHHAAAAGAVDQEQRDAEGKSA